MATVYMYEVELQKRSVLLASTSLQQSRKVPVWNHRSLLSEENPYGRFPIALSLAKLSSKKVSVGRIFFAGETTIENLPYGSQVRVYRESGKLR